MCNNQAYRKHSEFRKFHHGSMHAMKKRHYDRMKRMRGSNFYAPVNIEEFDDRYEIFLAAPGYEKSDFKISLTGNLLSLSVDKAEAKSESNWQRKEFALGAFKREFELSEKINQEDIEAQYKDGILSITLQKKDDFVTKRRDIDLV